MISKWVIILFLPFTVCEFCGKDFESLNRHKWRCNRDHIKALVTVTLLITTRVQIISSTQE